jgi:hypothetical protein
MTDAQVAAALLVLLLLTTWAYDRRYRDMAKKGKSGKGKGGKKC